MNAFKVKITPKPAMKMMMDGASQLDPAALYDAIQIIADMLPAEVLEELSNVLGRVAHMRLRG